jgi:hypothetical protein
MRRECYKEGFKPFASASAIAFWIKSNAPANDAFASDYPAGTVSTQLAACADSSFDGSEAAQHAACCLKVPRTMHARASAHWLLLACSACKLAATAPE